MCGIAGYFGTPDASLPRRALLAAHDRRDRAIAGPTRRACSPTTDVGLAHARLSHHRPRRRPAADGQCRRRRLDVTFNGEIFNYVELRDELIARGHRFRTTSDTEVILHAYEEMGPDCVETFNGDFAFALWDGRRSRLMLARDRMGVRPLFYASARRLPLLRVRGQGAARGAGRHGRARPDRARPDLHLLVSARAAHALQGHLRAAAGACADRRRAAASRCGRYWQLDYPDAADADALRPRAAKREIAEELRALLLDATRIRLRADVPVGAYLSGGLDSSIVTAAVQAASCPTGCAPSRSPSSAPSSTRARTSRRWCARSAPSTRRSPAPRADIGRDVSRRHPPHRAADPAHRAGAALSRCRELVRDSGFKVVLTGEGADEVFAGYDIFKEAKIRRFCARQPQSKRRPLLLQAALPLPAAAARASRRAISRPSSARGRDAVGDPLFSHLPRFRTTAGAKLFFSGDLRERARRLRRARRAARAACPPTSRAGIRCRRRSISRPRYLLPGYILSSQGDRVAMAHAVEGRFPFLDHRVVEFAARIPPRLKIRGLREKHILREAMKRPAARRTIGNRTKQPYRAPDSQSLRRRRSAPAYVGDRLSARDDRRRRLLRCRARSTSSPPSARSQTFIGFRDNMAFVGILSTQLWHRDIRRRRATVASDIPYAVA